MTYKPWLLGIVALAAGACGAADDPTLDISTDANVSATATTDPEPPAADLTPISTPLQAKVNMAALQAVHVLIENLTTAPERVQRLDGTQFVGILPSTSRFKNARNDTLTLPCTNNEGTLTLRIHGTVAQDSVDSIIEAEYQDCRTGIRTRTTDAALCTYHTIVTGKIACTLQGAATSTTEVHVATHCQTEAPCSGLTVTVDGAPHAYGTDMTAIYTKRENAMFLHEAFPREGATCIDDAALAFAQFTELSDLDADTVGCESDAETTDG